MNIETRDLTKKWKVIDFRKKLSDAIQIRDIIALNVWIRSEELRKNFADLKDFTDSYTKIEENETGYEILVNADLSL